MLLFLLVLTVRISLFLLLLLLFFFSRGARGHAVVMVNDPFSDLPFFGNEEFVWSEITNPFLDSPKKKKTHPNMGTYLCASCAEQDENFHTVIRSQCCRLLMICSCGHLSSSSSLNDNSVQSYKIPANT